MKKALFLSILFFWYVATPFLQAQPVSLTEIPALKKLPVNAIHRVYQDKEGYIWYGTVNGLCRDDGYRIQVFRADYLHPKILDNNLIECITEDRSGRIWFGTRKGAYILDKQTYRIERINHPALKNRTVVQMYTTSDGNIWLSTPGTLLRFDGNGQCRKEYATLTHTRPTTVSGFCESRAGDIIISLSSGILYRIDRERDSLTAFPDKMKRHNPGCIIQDCNNDYFWMCTWGDGLVRFNPAAEVDGMFVYQSHITPDGSNLMYLTQDPKQGMLWATSDISLLAFSVRNNEAYPETSFAQTAAHSMLNEIVRDSRGDLWVTAFDRPSFIIHPQESQPKVYTLPALKDHSKHHPAVMALCDAGDGKMWIFQERTAVFLYDLTTHTAVSHLQQAELAHQPLGLVKIMEKSAKDNGVWIAPENKPMVFRLTRKGMKMKLDRTVSLSPYTHDDAISAVYEDRQGRYLYAGTQKGLFRLDLLRSQVETVCDTLGHVTGFIETEDRTLYVCTYNKGLYALFPDGKMHRYHIRQALSCLTRTTDGLLWTGSDEGDLLSLDPNSGRLRSYNRMCHLNGDMINRVAADEYNHLWVGTNQKIIEFNPHNGSYRTFLTGDGSAGLWRLIPTALCKGLDGKLYFGGISGISCFSPSNVLEREASTARVYITDILTGEGSLFFDSHRIFDPQKTFEIKPGEKNLTIRFSTLNHRMAHKIRYAYRMKGIDNEWLWQQEEQPEAVYNHLPRGTYDFEVKATDENGLWSNAVTTLRIRRLPAWWESWWAFLIYIAAVVGCAGAAVRHYVNRMKKRNDALWADSEEMLRMRDYLKLTDENKDGEQEQLGQMLLEKAVKTVEENLSEPDFGVQQLAEAMNMSRSTLTRKLKSITGDTPLDFIRHIKMKHARRMLQGKNINVSEVGAALGYFNRKYFTSCFKEEFGMTPSEYQKSCEERSHHKAIES